MNSIPPFPEATVETIARTLGECGSGSDISRVLRDRGLEDRSGESTKWRRLYHVFLESQQSYRCANRILDFIQALLHPTRFTTRHDEFETARRELNTVLLFSGLEYGPDGQFRRSVSAGTIDEAARRANVLRAKFQGRRLHSEVLKYCRVELLQDNFFHAVFEATKGLAQRIRDLSGIQSDGAQLVDQVFSVERPVLAINTLQTETERSEHKGFAMLLKGCFGAIRNPLAHEPKILWEGEEDAADYLTLLSLMHRKLDDCVPTNLGGRPNV
jgi:uncharacterized protein (TIGR02391 family)